MSVAIEYLLNKASEVEIAIHLSACDADFVPPLSGRIEISDYAKKIASNATRLEAWSGNALIGLVAVYCNDQENGIAFITNVSVLRPWTSKGIATNLMSQCIEYAKALGMQLISLELASNNISAINLYDKSGFVVSKANTPFIFMDLHLKAE